jgi:hypothetical protein
MPVRHVCSPPANHQGRTTQPMTLWPSFDPVGDDAENVQGRAPRPTLVRPGIQSPGQGKTAAGNKRLAASPGGPGTHADWRTGELDYYQPV